ncbi:MAG: [protein-PII] uridylyltransferase, partial [Thalassotalea sp.]|nr:[protein-PII] uridylyltransferase [Thalassotalea sp.]
MLSNPILPCSFTNKLATAAAPLSTKEIVALGEEFHLWLKQSFNLYEVDELVRARADYVDHVLQKVWCQHHLDEHQISLLAVGGYGRGQLHPQS